MPFVDHTPESLLSRSDSKNPATTCKGITSSGRPCRRSLASSTQSSPSPSPRTKRGVIAVLPNVNDYDDAAAAFFCWQHKEQAAKLVDESKENDRIKIIGLQKRSSTDTLMDRLGVLDIQENSVSSKTNSKPVGRPVRKETLPKQWQTLQGPLIAVPEDRVSGHPPRTTKPQSRPETLGESSSLLSLLCCVQPIERDHDQAPRIRHHEVLSEKSDLAGNVRPSNPISTLPQVRLQPPAFISNGASQPQQHSRVIEHQKRSTSNRPPLPRDPSSQTQDLLALIPKTLSPQTTSLLLSELAKPISPFDQDGGWIYIFWLTPTASEIPQPNLASSLLGPPSPPARQGRRTSEFLQDFTVSNASSSTNKTILLKIGRASNVQRRMNEWTRQCNYNLSLVRYYPHIPSSPAASPSSKDVSSSQPVTPMKVPHAHRVERLIHLELADKRVKRLCEGCGKEHREWFEVEATREGIKSVDAVVKRWVGWAEKKV